MRRLAAGKLLGEDTTAPSGPDALKPAPGDRSAELGELISGLELRPGAAAEAIAALESHFDFRFPADYAHFLTLSDGAEGTVGGWHLTLYSTAELMEKNRQWVERGFKPYFVIFGEGGGSEAFVFDPRTMAPCITQMPLAEYGLTFMVSEIGDLLEPLASLDPRPPNRLPLVSGRLSARQRAERGRHDALLAAVEDDQIARVTGRAWVRRKKGRKGHWEVPGPDAQRVALPEWDIWLDRAPGDPPREPDVVQPGSFFGAANRIWEHQDQSDPRLIARRGARRASPQDLVALPLHDESGSERLAAARTQREHSDRRHQGVGRAKITPPEAKCRFKRRRGFCFRTGGARRDTRGAGRPEAGA